MKTNEKAPEGTGIPVTGAIEINQVNPITDMDCCQYPVDPVIPELIEMVKRINELYESHGVLNVGVCGERKVQIYEDGSLFDLFDLGSYDCDSDGEYDRYFTTVGGVEFFCLVEKERKQNE